jgi:type I restriction enzyme, S subunit
MEVKPGYRQTESGVIPNDWDSPSLGEVLLGRQLGGNYKNSEVISKYPLIKMGNLDRGKINLNKLEYIISTMVPNPKDKLHNNDVLFNTRNTLELVGKVALWKNELGEAYFNSNIMRMSFTSGLVSSAPFMNYVLNTTSTIKQLFAIATGTTSVAAIYSRDLVKVSIPLPPKKEQESIAEALSDADAYIESLQKIIAKKRLIKQGAMQELLTGTRRLPGFNDEWVESQLGKSATLKARIGWQGLTTNEYRTTGDYYLVTGTEFRDGYIDWDKCHFVEKSRYSQDKNIQLSPRDVLVTKDGTIGKVALVTSLTKPATLNSGVFVIRPIKNAFQQEFFYYLLISNVFTEFLNQLSAGSTINHLYQKDFVTFKYSAPSQIEEQIAISKILIDLDNEILTLESKLSKHKELKLGMMQELLTGSIRLV